MSLSQYGAFIKTVECGSLTKAAEVLGYTQSGISHLLNALEKDMQMTLLIRERSGVRMTSDGQQLLPYFQAICNGYHNLSAKVKEIQRLESGLVRVGTFTSVSAQWLPGMIAAFQVDFPHIQFELLHGTNEENEAWVKNGRVDCAFVRVPGDEQLEIIFLRRDPLVAVLPENHPLAEQPTFPLANLPHYAYIKLYEGIDEEVPEVLELFQAWNLQPEVRFSEKDDYAIVAMVEKGLGISILPELVLKDTGRRVVSKVLDVPAYRDLGVAVRDQSLLSASAQTFLAYVQRWIAEEYGDGDRF